MGIQTTVDGRKAYYVAVDGSKQHYVADVHVKRNDDYAEATGIVSGKPVSVLYTGMAMSQFGATEAKPWLREVRRDLVRKYIQTYGDVPAKKVSKYKIDRMKKLRAEGKTYKEIGAKLGVSDTTVRKYIAPNKDTRARAGRSNITDEMVVRMKQLRSEGKSYKDIGVELGVSDFAVRKYISDLTSRNYAVSSSYPESSPQQTYTIMVDSDFMKLLETIGLKVHGTEICISDGTFLDIANMTQIEALQKIKSAKSAALEKEREVIKKLLAEIAA